MVLVINEFLFPNDGTLELTNAGNIKWFGIIENDDFGAEMAPRMVWFFQDISEARLERKIKRIVSSRRKVFPLQVPVF